MIPLGTSTKLSNEVMQAYRGPFANLDARLPTWQFARQLLQSEPFMRSLEQGLPQITHSPALLVWGGGDFALRKSHELPRLQEFFPNHQTLVLDRARHFFQEDAHDQVASAIRDWMEARSEQA